LDIHQQGYLDAFTLNYFFRGILKEMERHNQDPVRFEDVKDEIFDMVRPKDGLKITLQDLVDCGNGDVVVSILIDLNSFWTYENREVLVTDGNQ
jgi:serine/threonine-protein phosphatase 2A regulatory subunit B''